MKKGLIMGVIFIVIILAVVGYFLMKPPTKSLNNNNSSEPTTIDHLNHNIEILNFAFNPNSLSISVGDSVEWTNKDSATHTIVSDFGNEIVSPSLSSNEIYTHTFNSVGTYEYHCGVHSSMKGSIIVS